jgi:hypothetical protein
MLHLDAQLRVAMRAEILRSISLLQAFLVLLPELSQRQKEAVSGWGAGTALRRSMKTL